MQLDLSLVGRQQSLRRPNSMAYNPPAHYSIGGTAQISRNSIPKPATAKVALPDPTVYNPQAHDIKGRLA